MYSCPQLIHWLYNFHSNYLTVDSVEGLWWGSGEGESLTLLEARFLILKICAAAF
ncbi:hypothetical protein MICAD_740010 [Microcystis aeruginosa PCC 7941]|nr:hypothetical protein MICAD_740010 [Microcystis aeruginosa PCC 7941]